MTSEHPAESTSDDIPPVSAEALVRGQVERATGRRYPSTLGGMLFLAALVVTVAGLLLVVLRDWRLGVQVVGAGLVAAAVFRLVLPEREAGMLAVRSRWLDALVTSGVGGVLVFLSLTIPNQPGP
jgi:hypothetical protein